MAQGSSTGKDANSKGVPTVLAYVVYPLITLVLGGILGTVFQYQLVYKSQIEEAKRQTETGISQTTIMKDQLKEVKKQNKQKDAEIEQKNREITLKAQQEAEVRERNEILQRKLDDVKRQWEVTRSVFTSTITNELNDKSKSGYTLENAQTIVNERDFARTRIDSVRNYMDGAYRHLNSIIDRIRVAVANKDLKTVNKLMEQLKSEWDEKKSIIDDLADKSLRVLGCSLPSIF
jgi:hypothetical protein